MIYLHHHSSIRAMLWSLFCKYSWCYKDSHTFVITVLWHYHTQQTQQLQVVEHNAWSFRLDHHWCTWSSRWVPLWYLILFSTSSWNSVIKKWYSMVFPSNTSSSTYGLIGDLLSCIIPGLSVRPARLHSGRQACRQINFPDWFIVQATKQILPKIVLAKVSFLLKPA